MNRDDIRKTVLAAIQSVAPDADLTTLDPTDDLRDALDIDSMDFLAFATALHGALHIDVPEADYPKMRSVTDCVDYLEGRLTEEAPESES